MSEGESERGRERAREGESEGEIERESEQDSERENYEEDCDGEPFWGEGSDDSTKIHEGEGSDEDPGGRRQ